MAKKTRKPTDATMRNVRASKSRLDKLSSRLTEVELIAARTALAHKNHAAGVRVMRGALAALIANVAKLTMEVQDLRRDTSTLESQVPTSPDGVIE